MNSHASDKNLRRRILIVDDEIVNREMLGRIMEQAYEVLYADNGQHAMEVIREQGRMLSLILLDIIMPEMDGLQVLETLRDDEELSGIPVIVLTADKSMEIRSLELGAVDFISKPFDLPDVILARARRSIELAEDTHIITKAERDEVTGLYNRDFFIEYARRWEQYHPGIDRDAVVLNINHFHVVNELYGREEGDKLLRLIGGRLMELTSRVGGMACRAVSDHFLLYIPHQEKLGALVEEITAGLEDPEDRSKIRIRCGVCPHVEPGADLNRVFDRALIACNTLRDNYSEQVACYDEEMHTREAFSERLIAEMDGALADRQFKVFFQPKYDIRGEKPVLTSAEALVRWIHPELGFVRPDAFIPLFENNGMVKKLDYYVWREAARQIRAWKDKYHITVPVSVNVSRVDINDPRLEENLLQIVAEMGLETSEIYLEITESAYAGNSARIIEVVSSLRKLGFKVEMDDFGSGYSSLNMITSLPLDVIKLDMKFIRNMMDSEKNIRMVELMMDIAKFLGVTVVAEGVETKEQVVLLKKMGCDIIQGFYFSKPVPADGFEPFIEEKLK